MEISLTPLHTEAEGLLVTATIREISERKRAESELRRALESEKRLAESVSASELDQLRLVAEKTALEIEQAELETELARTSRELKENDVATAEHAIRQRKVTAPLAGFVAEINRRQGEWVQPGQTILRILRLDRLRAEGLVDARQLRGAATSRPVRLTVRLGDTPVEYPGKIVFVSPEIDPITGQVRVWAEIENRDLQLRPGLQGSMVIQSAASGETGQPGS